MLSVMNDADRPVSHVLLYMHGVLTLFLTNNIHGIEVQCIRYRLTNRNRLCDRNSSIFECTDSALKRGVSLMVGGFV